MTPDQAASLFGLIERYGLPLVVIGILGWAYLTGKLVTPGQVAQLKDQLAEMKALYERERLDRIAAEAMVAKNATASVELAEAVAGLTTAVVSRDPYSERLEGRRDR